MKTRRPAPGGSGSSAAADLGRRLAGFLGQGHTTGRGRVGQAAAEALLRDEGLRVVGRNWSCRVGEIDLLAIEHETLCIVEVKARASRRFGSALAAVGPHKQQRIARAASVLVASIDWTGPVRFDVVGLDREEKGWRATLVRGAFEA